LECYTNNTGGKKNDDNENDNDWPTEEEWNLHMPVPPFPTKNPT
jgi:hypothetical protein